MATYTININAQLQEDFTFSVQNTSTSVNTTFSLTFNNTGQAFSVDWGDGTIDNFTTGTAVVCSHLYSVSYSGNIIVTVPGLNTITSINSSTSAGIPINSNVSIFNVLTNLETLSFLNSCAISGNIETLTNPSLTDLQLGGSTTVTGSIDNIANVSNITSLRVEGTNTISGNISSLSSLNTIIVRGLNTLTGDINGFVNTVTNIILEGQNTLSGNISDLPINITSIVINGQNTITGDLATCGIDNVGFGSFTIRGNNTIFGDITTMNRLPLTVLDIQGINTISGNYNLMPSFPADVTITGNNTISGDMDIIIPNLNTVFVNRKLDIRGNNTINAPINNMSAYRLIVLNSNNGNYTGNIKEYTADEPFNLTLDECVNLTYTGVTNNWSLGASDTFTLSLNVSSSLNALSSSDLDDFIIDLDSYTFNKDFSNLLLTGGFSRTAASDTAYNNLIAAGMNINIT